MAQYDRMAVLNAIYDVGIVPVFYNKDVETTINVIEACLKGGSRV
ncbi:MAG: bifunctional 4-hydroxy-2-oxoglutarate aldolase/2-dehydro-3-deoxy-phosphogluconate aldolase, partial [Gemmatimonadetes bacterium]|nr:bifunctional 4-hydroxy-2-oxoglutarate aldolase/2-dehydro-3-deoxy-phosphogluconate aldolase [Gemmatimonadota bacterium]